MARARDHEKSSAGVHVPLKRKPRISGPGPGWQHLGFGGVQTNRTEEAPEADLEESLRFLNEIFSAMVADP